MNPRKRLEIFEAELLNIVEFLKEIQVGNPALSPLSTARAKWLVDEIGYPEFSKHIDEAIESTEEAAKALQKILDGLRTVTKRDIT